MPIKPNKNKKTSTFDIAKLFEIASKVTDPIALIAMAVVAIFGLCYLVLSLNIFTKIGASETSDLLRNLVDKFFWVIELALVVAVVAIIVRYLPRIIDSLRGHQRSSALQRWYQREVASPPASVEQTRIVKMGIRSFTEGTEEWEHDMNAVLSIMEFFDKRRICNAKAWQKEIFPRVQFFLREPCKKTEECHLHFRAHTSIAFAAGYCLPIRTGFPVFPVQYTPAPILWRPWEHADEKIYASWAVKIQSNDQDAKKKKGPVDVAIGIGVAQDLCKDVREYVTKSLPRVNRIFYFIIEPAPSNGAICDGSHAKLLADGISNFLKAERTTEERQGNLHIFAAAPHAFMFLLGQMAHSFGPCVMYEYDLERNTPGGYEPSMSFPPQ